MRLLIEDGVLAGFTYFREGGGVDRLLHPRDESTGIHFRLLPMIHAILSDLFTPEQARTHVALIREHLLAPDGARLFDRPPPYYGGLQRHFQRAETSTFFGREIGIMYTHAHLRYAEAMAHQGDADALFLALRQVNPVELREAVALARPRQLNCFTSSSDACFTDRYDAASRYDALKAGAIEFEGGSRVYSSGAGIATQLIHGALLGVRRSQADLFAATSYCVNHEVDDSRGTRLTFFGFRIRDIVSAFPIVSTKSGAMPRRFIRGSLGLGRSRCSSCDLG